MRADQGAQATLKSYRAAVSTMLGVSKSDGSGLWELDERS